MTVWLQGSPVPTAVLTIGSGFEMVHRDGTQCLDKNGMAYYRVKT